MLTYTLLSESAAHDQKLWAILPELHLPEKVLLCRLAYMHWASSLSFSSAAAFLEGCVPMSLQNFWSAQWGSKMLDPSQAPHKMPECCDRWP